MSRAISAGCGTSPTVLVTQGTGIGSLSEPGDPFTKVPGRHQVSEALTTADLLRFADSLR